MSIETIIGLGNRGKAVDAALANIEKEIRHKSSIMRLASAKLSDIPRDFDRPRFRLTRRCIGASSAPAHHGNFRT
jgi:hypothetical protein